MAGDRYSLHHRSEVDIGTDAHSLFALLDDHRRLAGHMEKPSLMMAGATMRVETDALKGQAVGSVIRVTGRVLGVNLAVEEVVTDRVPPLRKTWETWGKPRLLVIGSYRMGFTLSPRGRSLALGGVHRLSASATRLRLWSRADFRAGLRGMVHAAHGLRCGGGD